MTFDERLECLFKSTESLHATVQEMVAAMQRQDERIDKHTKQLEMDGEHIRALVRIAEIHERRLSALEGDQPPS